MFGDSKVGLLPWLPPSPPTGLLLWASSLGWTLLPPKESLLQDDTLVRRLSLGTALLWLSVGTHLDQNEENGVPGTFWG